MRLDPYWNAMNLAFHKTDEDASVSLAVLSLYLDTLLDYFSFYASLHPQFYSLPENEVITLQAFFHFLKLFKLIDKKSDIEELKGQDISIPFVPIDNTLNMKNGINFGQFLETILIRAYHKVAQADRTSDPTAYSEILQDIF